MTLPEPVVRLRGELEQLYGSRLKRLLVYGSNARGEATDASDIDVAVVLSGKVEPGREIDRMLDAVYALNLDFDSRTTIQENSQNEQNPTR